MLPRHRILLGNERFVHRHIFSAMVLWASAANRPAFCVFTMPGWLFRLHLPFWPLHSVVLANSDLANNSFIMSLRCSKFPLFSCSYRYPGLPLRIPHQYRYCCRYPHHNVPKIHPSPQNALCPDGWIYSRLRSLAA
ncbi:hypothetical protein BS50DRAFT_81898 [Corynespora cassiicola Philippines]|uniref:Uncharacterized protein n=1 Tax=Corynespora cassiicola Philippines TaxID=1448308 RepID=A0A2T2MZH8_CORCC|nr:hypothetical protein BS50DRAFT_81898 [Corynespora cassiicola Philippines]